MKRFWMTLGLGCLTACQSAPVAPAPVTAPAMAIDVASFESALAASPVVDWASNTFASPRLLEARQARAERQKRYHVAYTAFGTATWTKPFSGVQVSNATAYKFADVYASGPNPNDRLMIMTNAAKGTKSFFVLDPASGNVTNGTGWDVLTTVGAPNADKVDDSALSMSANGTQAMFVTQGGYFGAINTATGAKIGGFSLGAGRRTVRSAPFVDNSVFPGIDTAMRVWCASTDASDSVGQLHRFDYNAASGTPWTAAAAVTVSGAAADGSGGARTAKGFRTSPIAWQNKVYIGDVAGLFWEYDVATGTARYWDLSPFSGVPSLQILAPAAIDLGGPGFSVDKIFVAAGARVFWIDPVNPDVVVPSQNLLVDTATSTPGPDMQGSLNGYTYTGSTVPDVLGTESISVALSRNVSNPSINGYEITGSDGYASATDGNPVSGYVRFNVPTGAFGGRTPISAQLSLATDNYDVVDTSDAGSIYRASNFLANASGQDTTTLWTRGNLTFRNQPRLLVPRPFSSLTGPAAQYQRLNWNVNGAVPRDGDNYTFVLRGTSKWYLGQQGTTASPGFYGVTQGNVGGRMLKPYLRVTCSNYGIKGAIMNQPVLYSYYPNPRLYVANSNAVFELNYNDTGTFANAAETYFSLTAAGRGGAGNVGVIDVGNKFAQNAVTVAMSQIGSQPYIYHACENGGGAPKLGRYSIPFSRAANADNLQKVYSMPAGVVRSTSFVTWDYYGGSLYFADQGLTTSTLYRLAQ